MFLYFFLGLLLSAVILLLIYFIFLKNNSNSSKLSDDFFARFNQQFPQILNQANQTLVTMADQKLSSQKQNIELLFTQVQRQLDNNNTNFENLTTQLKQHAQLTRDLSATTDNLKKVLNNNQLRGAFGEQIAEDLLKMSGFVSGTDYEKQLLGDVGRPDFSIKMPDKTILNIDSKFPYSNLVNFTEAESAEQKDKYLKLFKGDISSKIKEVSNRDYVDPKQNTVDFVILFIPNEMIFSFVYDKFQDLWLDALSKKVILAGPFSFTAMLRLIRQSYDSFKVQKNIKEIIGQIQIFQSEFEKYNQEFEKIGERLEMVVKQYDNVKTTRTRQLTRTMDKISLAP